MLNPLVHCDKGVELLTGGQKEKTAVFSTRPAHLLNGVYCERFRK